MAFFTIEDWKLTTDILNNFDSILQEYHFCAAVAKPKITTSFGHELHNGKLEYLGLSVDTNLWTQEEKKLYTEKFVDLLRVHKLKSPISCSIIKKFPEIRQWFWQDLGPGAKVNKHYGVNSIVNGKTPDHLRLQFCFVPSDNSFFYLEKSKIKYEYKLCFGFEDGIDLHWVENNSNSNRLVLIIDVWKNMAPKLEYGHIKEE